MAKGKEWRERLNNKTLVMITATLIFAFVIYLILSSVSAYITGAMIADQYIQKIQAPQTSSCGDGYCDSTESFDICNMDCPYPEISR
jgi:hypothetical protein